MHERRSVLVTGASGGIGRAVVAALAARGFHVWAGMRGPDPDTSASGDSRIRTMALDITDPEQVAAAAALIGRRGPLHGVVNVAGVALPGPLEHVPLEQFRRQLEVNVTGQLAVVQAVLPSLRAGVEMWGSARVVIMGSLDARIVGPLLGPYAASKHALVGLSDALRAELRPQRIPVVLLEPGAVATPIWTKGVAVLQQVRDRTPGGCGPYEPMMAFAERHVPRLSTLGASPDGVGRAVVRALTRRSPSPRQVVGVDAHLTSAALRVLPQRVVNRLTALPAVWSERASRRRP